ncbi:recombinase family protein [Tsukamurella tyrosinosolvens]|uniref:recombinase family protein n=1 Tax=Tsukamurella tyrosinosolvens TaxID=57704 RepID=UPI001CE0938B|nr:recombinase family protein [Tsukamurella tyrosinosolvens]MCA4996795.1 recombinase family protein [Tsukamurella tyrosinosolvens]
MTTAVSYFRAAHTGAGVLRAHSQRLTCHQVAVRAEITVVEEFGDLGVSGMRRDRPSLALLLEFVQAHPVDYAICADMDTLASTDLLFVELARQLSRTGTRITLADLDAVIDVQPLLDAHSSGRRGDDG